MATVSDSFIGSGALGASWTGANTGNWTRGSTGLISNVGFDALARWGANTFSGDQFARVTVVSLVTADYNTGPMVKSAGDSSGFTVFFTAAHLVVWDMQLAASVIDATGLTISIGDVIEVRAIAGVVTVLQNGTLRGTYTMSPVRTGTYIGIGNHYASPSDGGIISTFAGGDYSAGATATTLTGPTSGVVSAASTPFTVAANGTITGTVIVTPSDAANGGTFTPATASISSGTPTATFTYTPASTGIKTISTTNNGALTNPTAISYTSNVASDTTPPTLTGAITASSITTTGFTISWPAGADNVAVTGYEYSLNGGTSYIDAGNVLTKAVTGLTPGTAYSVTVRAYDAAVNKSTPALTATVTTAVGTITTPVLKNNTGTLLASETGVVVNVYSSTTGALVVRKTALTSNTSGIVSIADALLVPGTSYAYEVVLATNGRRLPTGTAA